jgi:hypothetical protein
LPNPSQPSAIPISEPPKKEKTPLLDFMLNFEDEPFTEYGNTLNYYSVRKPQEPKKSSVHKEPLDPSKEAILKRTTKELVSIISNEWLEESELSSNMIRLDSPSTLIHCRIHRDPFEACYNLVVGKDGNGEFPVGFHLSIPVPVGQKSPRPHPREGSRGRISFDPRTQEGNLSPMGTRPSYKFLNQPSKRMKILVEKGAFGCFQQHQK